MDKKTRLNVIYAVIAVWVILIFQSLWTTTQSIKQIPYSEFEQLLEDGEVAEVAIGHDTIEGILHGSSGEPPLRFKTNRVEPELTEQLRKHGVTYSGVIQSTFLRDMLSWILPVVFFVAIWMFFIRRFAEKQGLGGMMSVGKSKAKVYVETDIKVSFSDVAGVDEAKDELKEIVDFLKHPEEYGRLGARIPKGILLVGPPGTGKTLLARAVAGEAAVPFFSISGSEFVEMFVGVGAARVRDLFEQAQKAAPCIIFIDELDALGRARGVGALGGGHDEKEQTLNQLLSELDGFDSRQGIVLLAATNRPEILDPALLRAGRFDRQVLVDRPDKPGRAAILEVHVRNIELADDVDPEKVAALTPGFSGADLANLVNEAAILATRGGSDSVSMAHFTAAIERIVGGLEKKSRLLNPQERKVVAFHEMGHALVAMALPGMDPVHKISIIPRGVGALGYTMQRPTEDRFLVTQSELENKMAVLLGGRAAEQLVFDEVSTGAADDLEKATEIARHMITRFGMCEELGQVTYETRPQAFLGDGAIRNSERREYSEETARNIDRAIKALTDEALRVAKRVLVTYRQELDESAADLLEKETLSSEELPQLRTSPINAGTPQGNMSAAQ